MKKKSVTAQLRDRIAQLENENRDLERELEDYEYDCSDCTNETDKLVKTHADEIKKFLGNLNKASEVMGTDCLHVITVYNDELEDMKRFLTELLKESNCAN